MLQMARPSPSTWGASVARFLGGSMLSGDGILGKVPTGAGHQTLGTGPGTRPWALLAEGHGLRPAATQQSQAGLAYGPPLTSALDDH